MSKVELLKKSFIEGLGLEEGVNLYDLVYRGIPEWDSMGHMQLVAQLEQDFDVMLGTQEVIDLSSFKKTLEILKKHGVNFDA